ncbi:LexA DNA binding domain-containing protein [Aureimonas altamirensis DSM 21988]|uniref:LexA repressor n=2 Tax=Aureimonas altamirensis TaxID=370622 RepID=A0A0P0YX31_9HYPH|nr:MarR family transcriptional regulator [Aureimonas altamirensis]BAT26036.1 LexA repressor [Aureimonas altamirensis]SHI79268.1 LexA DNA binding domain-containing protein [Aureimonas altamirensis DSM 21988]
MNGAANDTDSVAPFQRLGAVANRVVSDLDMDLVHEMKRHPAELREAAFRLQMEDAHTGLTPRQAEVLQFIHDHQMRRGSSPSFAQIGEALDIKSKSGVHRLVHGLAERGAVTLSPGRNRTTRINHAKGA